MSLNPHVIVREYNNARDYYAHTTYWARRGLSWTATGGLMALGFMGVVASPVMFGMTSFAYGASGLLISAGVSAGLAVAGLGVFGINKIRAVAAHKHLKTCQRILESACQNAGELSDIPRIMEKYKDLSEQRVESINNRKKLFFRWSAPAATAGLAVAALLFRTGEIFRFEEKSLKEVALISDFMGVGIELTCAYFLAKRSEYVAQRAARRRLLRYDTVTLAKAEQLVGNAMPSPQPKVTAEAVSAPKALENEKVPSASAQCATACPKGQNGCEPDTLKQMSQRFCQQRATLHL